MITDIFKIPVFTKTLNLNCKQLETFCLDYSTKNKSVYKSNTGGYQSLDFSSNKFSQFKTLVNEIKTAANEFSKLLDYKHTLNIHTMWININSYKDYNELHSHPKSFISGVYYISVPDNGGQISFRHPLHNEMGYDWQSHLFNSYNSYNSPKWFLPSVNNILHLFPSWLDHNVLPNLNKNEKRISISFNMI